MTVTKPLALIATAVLALAGCAGASTEPNDEASPPTVVDPAESPAIEPSIIATHGLAGLTGREMVDRLEQVPVAARPADLLASVRPGELLLSEVGSDEPVVVELPGDEFYLSVAPYREHTHDCFFHSLTTCRGELAGEQLHVTITDRDTGQVLVDEVTETFDNGFIGFWLPSGINATLQIEHAGLSASAAISTGPDDPTCLTTVQLA